MRGSHLDWAGVSNLHPFGVFVLIACILSVLMLSREYVVIPLLVMITLIPSAQRIVVVSLDFSFVRIILLFTIFRIFNRKEYRNISFEKPDRYIRMWAIWSIIAYGILVGELSGSVTRIGYMIEVIGAYFVGRVYLRSIDDFKQLVTLLGYFAIPTLLFFLVERWSGRNLFSVFGGVPEITYIRDGRMRCQGPFSHPITAGVFWASSLPLLAALWKTKDLSFSKGIFFIVCMVLIVINSASSTPIMAVIFGALGFLLFYKRNLLPLFRRLLLSLLIFLHLIMEAPVWHLISRINVVGGSTGWHRYHLIDKAVEHINEWWVIGILSTGHWGHALSDITNQYLFEGVKAGLLGMLLFILFLISVFSIIGRGMKKATSINQTWVLWALGVILSVHLMNFFAVSYFGQMVSAFYLFLGGTVSYSAQVYHASKKKSLPNI
mgnify:FL=1